MAQPLPLGHTCSSKSWNFIATNGSRFSSRNKLLRTERNRPRGHQVRKGNPGEQVRRAAKELMHARNRDWVVVMRLHECEAER
jgi:hypothetical protein